MAEEDFEVWLGSVGKDRRFAHDLREATNLARGAGRLAAQRLARFSGARIGRGAGVGRVLAGGPRHVGSRARRVVVKARFVRLGGKGLARAAAHLRYLQRDGTTREGERGTLYGADHDQVDGRAFLERCGEDRHQFRFIVAAEDGAEYDDLKPLVRRLMTQAEKDLGTKLDWVAVDHFNTGHPHSHILLRGVDDRGHDLVIARDYLSHGLRERAAEIVNLDLGPRSDREILAAAAREIEQERFTGIDRRLLQARDRDVLVTAHHRDPLEQARLAGRLGTLERMGLARDEGRGRYSLDPDLEPVLRAMGRRGDIIATMHQALRQEPGHWPVEDHAIFDPGERAPLVGAVVARGLADEQADRRYMIVAGIDGLTYYVDLGVKLEVDPQARIVRIEPAVPQARQVDRTIAAVAAAHGGRYSVDLHLAHDASATETFAETHVRRLEAMRRGGGGVERGKDGSWSIASDHIDRALAFEQRLAAARPVRVETLATIPIEALPRHDGLTWLDERALANEPEPSGRGFGATVRNAMAVRRQWLIAQELAVEEGGTVRLRANLAATLRQRELRRVATLLSDTLGLAYVPHRGGQIDGTYRQPVQVGSSRYAVIEDEKGFSLVPWRPVLDGQIGRRVTGIERGGRINWSFGRARSGPDMD